MDIFDFEEFIYPLFKEKAGPDFISIDTTQKVIKFYENNFGRKGKVFMQYYPKSNKVHISKDNEWINENGLDYISQYFGISVADDILEDPRHYVVIENTNIIELMKEVNSNIDNGCALVGGIFISINNGVKEYHQSMVTKKPN